MNGEKKFLTKFVNHLESVVDQLAQIFPNEDELKILSIGVNSYKRRDPSLLAKEYHKYIYKYNDMIEKRDINGLMALDLTDDLKDLGNANDVRLRIDYFKKLLESDISDTTKNNFMAHLQKLNEYILLIDRHEKSVAFE